MGSCYANFGYFGGVPKFPLRDVIENGSDYFHVV